MADLLIGHDVGTGGSKTVLADAGGSLLASAFEPYEVSYPQPNWAEQNPDDWWRAVCSGTLRVLEMSGADPADVRGVGFAGQMIGVVPVADECELLCPAIIWLDSRADVEARQMIRRMGGRKVFTLIAGALPSGKDVVCKLAWLKANRPDVYESARAFLDTTGYLVARATGEYSIDHTGAGGTGLLSNRTRQWSRLFARLAGTPLEKLPPVRRSIDIAGALTADAAREMGLLPDTPVIAGMADIPAAATGSGALEDGDAHIYIGSSSWLCLSVSKPRNLPKNGIVSVASPDPGMFIMLGESETAGMCLDWFARNLALPSEWERAGGDEVAIFGVLDEVAAEVEPGAGRLLFMPWLFGERAPVTDTTLRGAFANLSIEHDRTHMLRAIYEGVAYNLRWMMDEVEKSGLSVRSVRAIGGGAKSDVWMRIMADATGRTVETMAHPQEAGALGCALAVAVSLGIFGDYKQIKNVLEVRERFEPDRRASIEYERLYKVFRDLHPALSKASKALNSTP